MNLTVLLTASEEERGRTFQVYKIHALSLSRAKSCIPNKAAAWEAGNQAKRILKSLEHTYPLGLAKSL